LTHCRPEQTATLKWLEGYKGGSEISLCPLPIVYRSKVDVVRHLRPRYYMKINR
jgi:hypothetical protein